jgi:hypothetical protein
MASVGLDNTHSLWSNISVEYQKKEYQFPCYTPTGEVFNHDPSMLIRIKCLALTCLTPLVSVARSIYWFANAIFMVLKEIFYYLDGQDQTDDTRIAMGDYAYESLRVLGYGTLMTGSALMGVVAPYQSRLHYGWLERELNYHSDGPHRDKFYLAICFQRLYVLSEDEEETGETAEKLTKYLARVDAIRAAFWSCSLDQLMVELRLKPAKHP